MKVTSLFRTTFVICLTVTMFTVSLEKIAYSSEEAMPASRQTAENTDAVPIMTAQVNELEIKANASADLSDVMKDESVYESDTNVNQGASEICDPLAPVNQVVFQFNDKLYYWGLKPMATAFTYVMPEFARVGFSNAFNNLKSPVHIVNNLLQLQFSRSFLELARMFFNSVLGFGGFVDASSAIGIQKQDADFGQTLGWYGVGQGCYLVLPVLGPTSYRDGIGFIGDKFMSPMTYLSYFYLDGWQSTGTTVFEKTNETSFRIGDYEFLTNMSVDPYLAQRNAYVQYRRKKIKEANER